MSSSETLREDAERYRRLLALGIPDDRARAALGDLIAKCEDDADALEAEARKDPPGD